MYQYVILFRMRQHFHALDHGGAILTDDVRVCSFLTIMDPFENRHCGLVIDVAQLA